LAINSYTGGLADWPSRFFAASGASLETTMIVHTLLAAVLVILTHRFLRIHGSLIAAAATALLLSTDWIFVFFHRALGGTEVLLQACTLLCLWAVWSRRWAGGRHGLTGLALGIGLGLMAKLTFILTVVALALTTLFMRWDKPRLRPPLPDRPWILALALTLPMIPMFITWIHHHLAMPISIPSHDYPGLQFDRVWATLSGEARPARESLSALVSYFGDSCSFLSAAWQAEAPAAFSLWRVLGWLLVIAGCGIAWRDQHGSPRLALTRFCSVFLLLQIGIIWLVARDLHHLAVTTPTLMILAGLSLEIVAGMITPPKSLARWAWVLLLVCPWMFSGIQSIHTTDGVLTSIERPTVSKSGQQELVRLLQQNNVQRVITMDYETAGALDLLLPHVEFNHAWLRIAQERSSLLPSLVSQACGSHMLVIPNAPSWTYNLKPRESDLVQAAVSDDCVPEVVDHLPDGGAVLYAVGPRTDRP
jgi:4-amino-4-deoxy-L-arabinose transferase-like glycosyltransferase